MVIDQYPFPIAFVKHHGKTRRIRSTLALANIRKRVVAGSNCDLAVDPYVLFADRRSCVGAFGGVLEILSDQRRCRPD
jgi:hypothetical protein